MCTNGIGRGRYLARKSCGNRWLAVRTWTVSPPPSQSTCRSYPAMNSESDEQVKKNLRRSMRCRRSALMEKMAKGFVWLEHRVEFWRIGRIYSSVNGTDRKLNVLQEIHRNEGGMVWHDRDLWRQRLWQLKTNLECHGQSDWMDSENAA